MDFRQKNQRPGVEKISLTGIGVASLGRDFRQFELGGTTMALASGCPVFAWAGYSRNFLRTLFHPASFALDLFPSENHRPWVADDVPFGAGLDFQSPSRRSKSLRRRRGQQHGFADS
jgi:hypothetical protein